MGEKIIVNMRNITMSFSGNKVLDSVNFELRQGEIHSLMGANGAGKSTLIKILNGLYRPVSGTIEIEGEIANIKNPKDAEKYGLAFVHQELNLCDDMTVAENIYIGDWEKNKYGLYDKKRTSSKAEELLNMMGASLNPNEMIGNLRLAEKQIIEILKALTQDVKIIVLDEPTSSLNEKEKENLFQIISNMKKRGISIIFISHFIEDVMQLSDKVTVLKDGLNSGHFVSGKFTKDDLITAMMGRKIEKSDYNFITALDHAPVALELKNFSSKKKFKNINIKIQEGEIVGVCGLLGAGKTEIARAIFGIDKYDSGEIFIYGNKINKPRPDIMIKNKVVFLSEDRKIEGFIPLLSIRENTTLSIIEKMRSKFKTIDNKKQKNFVEDMAKQMTIKMSSIEQSVVSLSGGNQQKVIVARCLSTKPKLFLLDEPTRGVDVYAKSEIYKILRKTAKSGTSILIFSSELEELLENCSRIIILKKGSIAGSVNTNEVTKKDLLSMIS